MSLRLPEMQESKSETREFAKNLPEDLADVEGLPYHQNLLYVPKIGCSKIISRQHDDPLVGHFGIKKMRNLVARKYFWPTIYQAVEAYVKDYDVYLALMVVYYKSYKNF